MGRCAAGDASGAPQGPGRRAPEAGRTPEPLLLPGAWRRRPERRRPQTTPAGLASLAQLPALRCLDLQNCHKLGGAGLAALAASAEHLAQLSLKGCAQLGDPDVATLAGAGALTSLNLQGCSGVGGACFEVLGMALQRLELLSLDRWEGRPASCAPWACLQQRALGLPAAARPGPACSRSCMPCCSS